jgi:hypothetical protein
VANFLKWIGLVIAGFGPFIYLTLISPRHLDPKKPAKYISISMSIAIALSLIGYYIIYRGFTLESKQ